MTKTPPKVKSAGWIVLKSGAMRNRKTGWYAARYVTGWWFYPAHYGTHDRILGPYKTFEAGLKIWETQQHARSAKVRA